ncbi:damage-control phosphatase [Microdochium nivale]|nr:damage-control phosphatase [Microdochium nivale]
MEFDTKTPPYVTSDKTSFAYISARDRWPVIITGAIDDVHRTIAASKDTEKDAEGKRILEDLVTLKYELQHDRKLSPIRDDGQPDVALYNNELEALGTPSWFNVPWLFSECYLYRRVSTFFSMSQHWKSYDIFARQKNDTFRSSRPAVYEIATRFKDLVRDLTAKPKDTSKTSQEHEEAQKLLFVEMCEICLWGNATDLSLLTSLSYEDIQKLQGAEARKASEKNILVNDLQQAYETLKKARDAGQKERRVDIVLDNSGFELYVDLVLSSYLLTSGLATHVVLHPKSIPWFVSDVLPSDFASILSALANPTGFFAPAKTEDSEQTSVPLSEAEAGDISFVFGQLAQHHAEGQLLLRPNRFWTHGGSFWRLPSADKQLHEDLKTSELVIFKGDLNYRKLTGDAMWDPTTPFTEAIGPLGPGSGVNVMALRTCKADVVVGLAPGLDEELRARDGGGGGGDSGSRKWAWSGKYAVVSYSGGK